MKRSALILMAIAGLLMAAFPAWAGEKAPLSTQELKQVIGSGKKATVVFFQNPLGGPCRAQKAILEKLRKDRKNNFNVANVSTMRQKDRQAFYDYGIRSLPTLIIVDKAGMINRVFPPGIQEAETLTAALDAVK